MSAKTRLALLLGVLGLSVPCYAQSWDQVNGSMQVSSSTANPLVIINQQGAGKILSLRANGTEKCYADTSGNFSCTGSFTFPSSCTGTYTGPFASGTTSTGSCVNGTTVATFAVPTGAAQTSNFLNMTGTFPSTLTAAAIGASFSFTTGGTSSQIIFGNNSALNSGYTGSSTTIALTGTNSVRGTAAAGWAGTANIATRGFSSGIATGHRIGVYGTSLSSSTMNWGGVFTATSSSQSPTLNIGMGALALNGTNNVAVYAGLNDPASPPTIAETAALIADNGAIAANIAAFRDNGTTVSGVADGGGFFGPSINIASGGAISALAAGVWTPTLTNVANLDASTAFECQYSRVGNTVTGSCRFSVDPTTTLTSTSLGFTLPVASNFGAVEDAAGSCAASAIAGQSAAVIADAANDRMTMIWNAADVTNQPMTCSFAYQVQ